MRVLVIAHDHVSPIGPVGERFAERGYEVVVHDVVPESDHQHPNVTTHFPDFSGFDAVVPMGAPWSAYDEAHVGAWVGPEMEQLRAADDAGVPVLGICFGGQLLAQAHGGRVQASARPEVGWYDVESTAPHIVPAGPWFQWHYDSWSLPPGGTEIARNENASQAYVLRRNLAVQFHPELTGGMLEGWLRNGGDRKAREFGLDPVGLLEATRAVDDRSRARAHALVDGFLAHVANGAQVGSGGPQAEGAGLPG